MLNTSVFNAINPMSFANNKLTCNITSNNVILQYYIKKKKKENRIHDVKEPT